MKKLKLNLERLNNVEVLTRSQLKNVLGGSVQLSTNAPNDYDCYCNNDGASAGADSCGAGSSCEIFCKPHGGVKSCEKFV